MSGPKVKSLDVILKLDRRSEPPLSGAMCDILWADPLLEDVLGYRLSDKDYSGVSHLSLSLQNIVNVCVSIYPVFRVGFPI